MSGVSSGKDGARTAQKEKTHIHPRGSVQHGHYGAGAAPGGIPAEIESYFISFIDGHNRYAYVANIAKHSHARQVIQDFLSRIQRTTGRKQRWLVSDNAGEYMAEVFSTALVDLGIVHIQAILTNYEENGIAERFNRTIINAVRTALITAKVPWDYWHWELQDAIDK